MKVLRIMKTPECERRTTQSCLSLLRHFTAMCPPLWKRDFEREVVSLQDGYAITKVGLRLLRMAGHRPTMMDNVRAENHDIDGAQEARGTQDSLDIFNGEIAHLFETDGDAEVLWSSVTYRGWPLQLRRSYDQDPAVYDISYLVGTAWALLCGSITHFYHVLKKPQLRYCRRECLNAIVEQGPPTWQKDVQATLTYQEGHLLITPQGLDLFLRILPLNLRRHLHLEPLNDASQDLWREERIGPSGSPVLTRAAYGPDEKLYSIPAMMHLFQEVPGIKELFETTTLSRRLSRRINKIVAGTSHCTGTFASSSLCRWVSMPSTHNLFNQTVSRNTSMQGVGSSLDRSNDDDESNAPSIIGSSVASKHAMPVDGLVTNVHDVAAIETIETAIANANAHAGELRHQRRRSGTRVDCHLVAHAPEERLPENGENGATDDEHHDVENGPNIDKSLSEGAMEEKRPSRQQRRQENRRRQQEAARRRREHEQMQMETRRMWRDCGKAFAPTVMDHSVDSPVCEESPQQIERNARQKLQVAFRRQKIELRRQRAPQKLRGALVQQLFFGES